MEIWAGGERGGSQGIIIIQPSAFVTLKPNCYPLLVTTLKCWPFKCFLIFIFFFFNLAQADDRIVYCWVYIVSGLLRFVLLALLNFPLKNNSGESKVMEGAEWKQRGC